MFLHTLDSGQKILGQRHTFTRYEHAAALGRIDNFVAVAQTASDQRNLAIALSCCRNDLGLAAIGIHRVIAFLRGAYVLAVIQLEFPM
jgi:hypothetical protein